MRFIGLSAFVAILAAVPALAADLEPDDSAAIKLLRTGLANPPNPIELHKPYTLKTAAVSLAIGETAFADVAKAFGGTVNHAGPAGEGYDWLCYASPAAGPNPPALYWFVTRNGGEDAKLTGVATEPVPATVPAACTQLTAPLVLETGVPGLGADYQVLVAQFGTSDRDPTGVVGYVFPLATADDKAPIPDLRYALNGDKVVAVSFGVKTRPQ